MRRPISILALLLCLLATGAGPKTVPVRSYTRKDGTVVQAHMRSPPGSGSSAPAPTYIPAPLLPSPPRLDPRLDPRLTARTASPAIYTPPTSHAPPAQAAPVVVPVAVPVLPPESVDEERERRAGYKLRTAKSLLEQVPRAHERAIDALQDLLDQYPNTRAAAEGRVLLQGLQRR